MDSITDFAEVLTDFATRLRTGELSVTACKQELLSILDGIRAKGRTRPGRPRGTNVNAASVKQAEEYLKLVCFDGVKPSEAARKVATKSKWRVAETTVYTNATRYERRCLEKLVGESVIDEMYAVLSQMLEEKLKKLDCSDETINEALALIADDKGRELAKQKRVTALGHIFCNTPEKYSDFILGLNGK